MIGVLHLVVMVVAAHSLIVLEGDRTGRGGTIALMRGSNEGGNAKETQLGEREHWKNEGRSTFEGAVVLKARGGLRDERKDESKQT